MNLRKNVLLKNYSNYEIGGPARLFVEIRSIDDLKEVLSSFKEEKVFILGGGTKILISDKGFDGLIVYNRIEGIEEIEEGLMVGSGVLVKDIVDYCVKNSLSGFEWAGGLPGTIGGAVRGNAGAFKGETKDAVLGVESLDMKTFVQQLRNSEECQFGYRTSIFKTDAAGNEFITRIILKLTPGDRMEIYEKTQQKVDYRNNRHPMDSPSIGSTFKNIPLDSLSPELQKEFSPLVKVDPFPVVLATKLLALCNLKGKKVGGAVISDKHPNFIINTGNATAKDVKELIEIAKEAVKKKYNIDLEEEIIYLD